MTTRPPEPESHFVNEEAVAPKVVGSGRSGAAAPRGVSRLSAEALACRQPPPGPSPPSVRILSHDP